jgi:hypothetical protein
MLGLASALTLSALALSSCESIPATACPPVKEYTQAEQAQAKKEIAALPATAILRTFIDDYKLLRDAARACVQPDIGKMGWYPEDDSPAA